MITEGQDFLNMKMSCHPLEERIQGLTEFIHLTIIIINEVCLCLTYI